MENTPARGGKRPGAGRKPKPPDERRDQIFSVRLTDDEMQLLSETNAREWARETLVKAAKRRQERGGDRGN